MGARPSFLREPSATTPGWQPLLDRIDCEKDPVRRANLSIVARHVVEEVAGNMGALMGTLVESPEYLVWGASDSVGPSGQDEVVDWYTRLQSASRNRLDYVIHRVVVDENTVVTEGDFFYAILGRDLTGFHVSEIGEALNDNDFYLVGHRTTVLWPVSEDGLIEGEHIYAGERHRVVRQLRGGEYPHLGPASRGQA